MDKFKQSVALTKQTGDNMSRHELLDWINALSHGNYKKIEELCSGIAYCHILELLYPNSIGAKRIKVPAKFDREHLHNLKLLQSALFRLKIDKTVPIDRLLNARFQDNLEFLQWFKKFYDSHGICESQNNNNNIIIIRKPPMAAPLISTVKKDIVEETKTSSDLELIKDLKESQENLIEKIQKKKDEINAAYTKLHSIESVLKESIETGTGSKKIHNSLQTILYNEASPK